MRACGMVFYKTGRRDLLRGVTAGLALGATGNVPLSHAGLATLPPRPNPITAAEILTRIARAQVLMREQGLAAIFGRAWRQHAILHRDRLVAQRADNLRLDTGDGRNQRYHPVI